MTSFTSTAGKHKRTQTQGSVQKDHLTY
jgi:hypothetical protein